MNARFCFLNFWTLSYTSGDCMENRQRSTSTKNFSPNTSLKSNPTSRMQANQLRRRGAHLWNPEVPTVTMSFGPQRVVRSASFSHDSQFIVCAGADGSVRMAADGSVKTGGTVKFWQLDRATRRWLPAPKLIGSEATAAFNWAVFHPQRNDVILTAGNDGKAQLWKDEDGWKPFLTLDEHSQAVHCAIFSPDGSKVLTASADSVARV